MKHNPLLLPLLESLAPYENYEAICTALQLDLIEDDRCYWHIYTDHRPMIHWWECGSPAGSFLAIYPDGRADIRPFESGTVQYRSIHEALDEVRKK